MSGLAIEQIGRRGFLSNSGVVNVNQLNKSEARIMKENIPNTASMRGIACALLLASGSVSAQVVPFTDPAPLSCETTNFAITADVIGGAFPSAVPCDTVDASQGTCSDYGYTITSRTGAKIDHTLIAVSVDQAVHHTIPDSTISQPGSGDSTTGFLAYARHEYPIRFNSNGTTYNANVYIKGRSSPRISTILIKSGKTYESCLIAGPGIAGDPFQPVTQTESTIVAGGKCPVTKIFDVNGNLVDIALNDDASTDCYIGRPPEVRINDQILRNNTSKDGITFGDNTTTCYGPPMPKTPLCVCTKTPCP